MNFNTNEIEQDITERVTWDGVDGGSDDGANTLGGEPRIGVMLAEEGEPVLRHTGLDEKTTVLDTRHKLGQLLR